MPHLAFGRNLNCRVPKMFIVALRLMFASLRSHTYRQLPLLEALAAGPGAGVSSCKEASMMACRLCTARGAGRQQLLHPKGARGAQQ